VKLIIAEKKGKRHDLQHQEKDESRVPSDEEKYITHLQDDLKFDIPIPKRAKPGLDFGY
jgi:hypothetical protein